tara:strand:+ start:128 stop:328 length:201 start_codon:yes stop_codon:yes gene_type:complete
MKIGELVRHTQTKKIGVVVRVFMHKMWRTEHRGTNVDFNKIQPEPFAEVQFGSVLRKVPQTDLEYA